MHRDVIKDFYNRIIGYVDIEDDGFEVGKNFYNQIVAKYDPKRNVTLDFYNRIVGRGNLVRALIYSWEQENNVKKNKK